MSRLFTILALCLLSPAASGPEHSPPETLRGDATRSYHGREVAAPYAWLEQMNSVAVRKWSREQGKPELLLDTGRHLDEGEILHRQIWPSPDGRWLAYGVTGPASRWMELRFLDLNTGKVLSDRLTGLIAMSSTVSWSADSSAVYYERFALPPPEERLQALLHDENVLRHILQTEQRKDIVVYDSRDPENEVIAQTLSDDGRFLLVTVRDGRENHNRVLAMDTSAPDGGFRNLAPGVQANFSFVGSRDGEIWLQTDFEATRGRVVGLHWDRLEDGDWREIVPEQAAATIDTWVGARGAGDGLVVGYRKDSRLYFDYFTEDGKMVRRFEPPNLSSVWTGMVGRQGADTVFFTITSFADPGTVYRLNLGTGAQTVFRQPELSYDPTEIVVEQHFYKSESRERVPIFLAYHEDTPPDGTRPVMMYGYGFGGWIAAPWFRPHLPEWFLSGGTFALPALRGGGEYGEDWHRAGTGTAKTAAVDDFIAAAEWLVDAGLVRPSLLVAETNSAGGPVVGAAIIRRPDLFGAAILAFPLLHMLGYENYTHAGRWRSELGSVQDPEEFAALLSYSPPHNVTPGTCYPPVLLAPGALDEITPPMHAYKFAAALQHAGNCGQPALLRVSWNAGHAYGGTAEETAATLAAQLIFLQKVLDR